MDFYHQDVKQESKDRTRLKEVKLCRYGLVGQRRACAT